MTLPAARPPRRLEPTRRPASTLAAPRKPRSPWRRPELPDPVLMPPLPRPPRRAAPEQDALSGAPAVAPAAPAALKALVSARTLQTRFDLDEAELATLCAQLTPVMVATMTR